MQDYIQFGQQNLLLVAVFFGVSMMLILTEMKRFTRGYEELTTHQAVRLMNDEETLVVDVREKKDVSGGMLNGAKHIPYKDFSKRMVELDKHKNKNVLMYCDTGMRSGQLCQQLKKAGFESVQSLKGGAAAWAADNLPLEK